MPSDPSFGTTGFFSYLWTPRKPVYDADTDGPALVDNFGNAVVTNDGAFWIVLTTGPNVETIVRWM